MRDFPTIYRRDDGAMVNVGFDVISVMRDGSPEPYGLERKPNGWSIRIGDPDKQLTQTQHEYVIRYKTRRQVGFFAEFDELYWNATGTGWTFPIDEAEARIALPERVPFRTSAVYTGPQGARGKDARVVDEQAGRIVFRTTRPLPRNNGLTVAASFPKGVVLPPSVVRQTIWLLQDNPAVGVAAVGVPLVFGFYFIAWLVVGRDPPRGTIIPLFAPPDGMSAAAVRYVDNMGFDDKCFTVAIIDLGVRGHVRLTGSGSSTIIAASRRRERNPVARAGGEEQAVRRQLFAAALRHQSRADRQGEERAARRPDRGLRRQAVQRQLFLVGLRLPRCGGGDRRHGVDHRHDLRPEPGSAHARRHAGPAALHHGRGGDGASRMADR